MISIIPFFFVLSRFSEALFASEASEGLCYARRDIGLGDESYDGLRFSQAEDGEGFQLVWGQRPWVRSSLSSTTILEHENCESSSFFLYPLSRVALTTRFHNEWPRATPPENGLSFINARVAPLAIDDDGTFSNRAGDLRLRLSSDAQISKYFMLHSDFETFSGETFESTRHLGVSVPEAYAKFAVENFEILVGRAHLAWGHSDRGGLLFSGRGSSFAMVRLSAIEEFHYPWIFKHLGPSRIQFFVGEHDDSNRGSSVYLYGIKLSFLPHHRFEFGLSHVISIGNIEGASVKWIDPISEFFFIRRSGLKGHNAQEDVADHRFGFDFVWRLPIWRNPSLYADFVMDDLGKESLRAQFEDQMALMSGIYLPVRVEGRPVSLRFEFVRTPPWVFRHANLNGHVVNERLYGEGMEPDANSLRLKSEISLTNRIRAEIETSFEWRHYGIYDVTLSRSGQPNKVFEVEPIGTEKRSRTILGGSWFFGDESLRIKSQLGYQRIWDFNYTGGIDRNDYLFSLGLEKRWGKEARLEF